MAISYEEAKRQILTSQMATMSLRSTPAIAAETPAVMTLDANSDMIAAYNGEDEFIRHTSYIEYAQFSDDKMSYIDENKNVTVNDAQINLTQEMNSQYIPFEMNRYYDGIDLTQMTLLIHFVNKDGDEGDAAPINVYYNSEKIRFAWLADKNVTAIAGKVEFEIQAWGTVPATDPGVGNLDYVWKTRHNGFINIEESLAGNGRIEPSEDWMTTFLVTVNSKVAEAASHAADAQNAVAESQAYAQQAADSVTEAQAIVDGAKDEILAEIGTSTDEKIATALEDYYTASEVDAKIEAIDISDELANYYTKTEIDQKFEEFDISDQLVDINKKVDAIDSLSNLQVELDSTNSLKFYNGEVADENLLDSVVIPRDPSTEWTTAHNLVVDDKIAAAVKVTQDDLNAYKETTNADLSAIHDEIDGLPETLQNDYYTKEATNELLTQKAETTALSSLDTKVSGIEATANANKEDISSISQTLGDLQEEINGIDKTPGVTYDLSYNENGDYKVTLWEIQNEGQGDAEVRSAKSQVVIQGGSGGSSTSSSLKIEYVTKTPITATVNDKIEIKYNFSGTDSSGDAVLEGVYTWKIGNSVIATGTAVSGENKFDITDYINLGTQKVILSITDDAGSLVTKNWTVQKIDVRLESNFNDKTTYPLGSLSFNYTPYGTISKVVHFILDGEEIGTDTTTASGIPMSYTIPAQSHGAHLLEAYMTVEMNNTTIESNRVFKDIIWYDASTGTPVVSCVQQNFAARQYDSTNIEYTVYDPTTETPTVQIAVDGVVVSSPTLEKPTNIYIFKTDVVGDHTITITCGQTVKTLKVNVTKLDINIEPITAGLMFDFNPSGRSNNDANRLWSDGDISMTVSDNFDWVNGGYQIDENGDQYFCVKAGTSAVINYNLFADDPKANGKEFKVIFRTKNIRKRDTSFLSCMNGGIGLEMKVENATVNDTGGSLKTHYCEDAIIEYEFNINKDSDMMIVMSYEDGTPGMPYEYKETSSFKQSTPQPITIGSANCDVFIYRMKAYNTSLTDRDIKNNFIADARNAAEMLSRYYGNQIYNENNALIATSASGDFNVDALMKAAPELRYIFLEVPQFTNDKDNKIDGCTVYFRYPNGKRPQDNWTCTGVRHRGQGTSSNLYGYAGRNIDLCMDRDESLFTYVGEEGNIVESSTITLSDTSYPTDYLNIKVNIASSENENNAQLARRFNEYQPFLRYARKKDSRIKDTMEFYDCVVFIRETSTDPSVPHREFNDTNWHFYAIGNVGDSKKTDDTRVNNAADPKEHIIEITDADKPLCAFPTGKDGHAICPIEEWATGNAAYDILHSTEYIYDEEGKFESFGGTTYEFRYEMEDITTEQREVNINAWRDLYKFIVTSTDEEFHEHLKDYFVVDSALYYYLFTERYTMVDNRAKNSFWHYGKVYISKTEAVELGETEASYYIIDDDAAAINSGYRYDLTMGYDMDTALGIDNTGDFVFSYGKEDTDYYIDGNPSSDYVFRVADSVFFCRLRDLFPVELQAMFKNREEKNAWNSNSLITQWDNAQAHFPEELWRLDYERKYYRTYLGLSIDGSIAKGVDKTFLIGKFFGRKKYSRRAFEINQEMYFATKYFGNKALADVFWIRGNVPIGSSIKQNYSLTLVPYSDMYVCVQYTSTGTPIHKKMKAGETCIFESTAERMDFIYVYAASYIQEVGDLSRCYVGDNNFSSATRLQKLVIGSTEEGYENTFMTEVLVDNNPLLEHLDLRNISGINTVIDLSGCGNLKELYAEGTNATGVIFANGGLLHTAHLPRIASLSMKNLSFISDFSVDGYDLLQMLIIENTPKINTYDIINNAPLLKTVRLINLNWDESYHINDGAIFDRLLTIGGRDASGYETDMSVLTGNAYIAVMKQQQLYNYQKAWLDLNMTYGSLIEQFPVSFVNYDGTVLEVQYVDKGAIPVDPVTRDEDPLEIPVRESSVSTDYTFAGWDTTFVEIFGATTITATYTESTRTYTVKYVSKGVTMQESNALYGSTVHYDGDIPQYTAEESAYKYYLFSGWNTSGYVDGDKTVEAVYDVCEYSNGYFDGKEIADLKPVELYAITRLSKTVDSFDPTNFIDMKDSLTLTLGHDYSYGDIEEHILISERTNFTGANRVDTGIALMDEDRDFVLAIDYTMSSENAADAVLMQCYQGNGSNGIKLDFNSTPRLSWGTTTTQPSAVDYREMLVLRHVKGETGLHVYVSNLSGASVTYTELTRNREPIANSTLVFGCAKADDGKYENYAIGTVYWSKVWYTDLGDAICRELASWPHEKVGLEMCGFNRYYLSDNSGSRTTMTFLASNVLCKPMAINSSSTNVGGWAQATLNSYLNERVYNALPIQWKQLVKQAKIVSSIGGKSEETSESNCYIAIPSLREMVPTQTESPYGYEGTGISYFAENKDRICSYDAGEPVSYWTRSPNTYNGTYFWYVQETGEPYGFNSSTTKYGVRIMLSI